MSTSSKLNLILLECFDDIFSNFKKDQQTLYSFLFVNRFWCKIIIPLLWKNPFSFPLIPFSSDEKVIRTLSSLLNEEERSMIIKQGIKLLPNESSSTLFNYALYIEEYDTSKILQSIKSWYAINAVNHYRHTNNVRIQLESIFEVFTKLIMRNSRNIKKLSLLPIYEVIDDIPDVDIFINSQFGFKNIQNLNIDFSFITTNLFSLLKSLKNICHNIQYLTIEGNITRMNEEIIDSIASLIKVQHNISFIKLFIINPKFTPILEALSTHSSSLTNLQLTQVSNGISLVPIRQLKNLQDLTLSRSNLDENIFNDFSNADFNLKSLYIADMEEKVVISSLLKLTNENLEKFYCSLNLPDDVIKDLFIRCPNIYHIRVLKSFARRINFKLLLMLEDSLTHLSIHPSVHVELNEISLLKLKFLNIKLPHSVNILENYLKTTCSPLQAIYFAPSGDRISKEYINALLRFSQEKKTLKTVGMFPNSEEFVEMTNGYLQIVDSLLDDYQ